MDTKRLTKYLLITFLITWGCWWGDALLVKITSLTESNVFSMIIFTVGGFGPTIAACICMEGGFTRKNLRRFLFNNTKKNCNELLRRGYSVDVGVVCDRTGDRKVQKEIDFVINMRPRIFIKSR